MPRPSEHPRAVRAAAVGVLAAGAAVTLLAAPAGAADGALAHPDSYTVRSGETLTVDGRGVFANDPKALTTVVGNTKPAHGTLSLQPDGTFSYTPAAGFTGTDSFTYTSQDAVSLYRTQLPPYATIGGVKIAGGAYGSSFTTKLGDPTDFYGLTDRGPNVDGPNGTKIEPIPSFTPAIGEFRLVDGKANLVRTIALHANDGTPFTGQVNCAASTGETITDLNGTVLPCNDTGYDSEGLVALPDGTFWVSDEYGPFVTHFDANGRQLGRLSPFDHSLPRELANRVVNKGMEGLTVTPDGSTLVGIMQSALQQPDLPASVKATKVAPLRIVTIDLATLAEHEYLYPLDNPGTTGTAVSEITALSNTQFLVDERDGKPEPNAYKKIYKIDTAGATDVGPAASIYGTTYAATKGGLLINGKTIEGYVGAADTATATSALGAVGITPVSKTLDLDLGGFVTSLDPTGGFFGHDKVEGVAALDGGKTLVISNDNDFGIDGVTNSTPPFQLHTKTLPNGQQDDGEYLSVKLNRVGDATTTTTVSILVKRASRNN